MVVPVVGAVLLARRNMEPPPPRFINSVNMHLVRILGGSVHPNDLPNGSGGFVAVDHDFYMSVSPVRQEDYLRVIGRNPSNPHYGDLIGPVECVTVRKANEFCRLLSLRERRTYRLPTATEWKYAYFSGQVEALNEEDLGKIAWFKGNSRSRPQSVRQLLPDRWGLYDMIGNVRQWCSDSFPNPGSGSALAGGVMQKVEGTDYLTAGGDCLDPTKCEMECPPVTRLPTIGFRVVCEFFQPN